MNNEQRADLDASLAEIDPRSAAETQTAVHPGAHQALGLTASPEYKRVMTDPRSTPEQRARAREREMDRLRKAREREAAAWRR